MFNRRKLPFAETVETVWEGLGRGSNATKHARKVPSLSTSLHRGSSLSYARRL